MIARKYYLLLLLVFITMAVCYCIYYKFYKPYNYPIDLVYMWVDGNDPKWLEKKNYWQNKLNASNPYAVSKARWHDRDELKYSLRSVALYLPWVRNIFIVTDNQVPAWLNTNHPKIKIIDHKDIFPQDALPVFNSMAIEARIPYIPGLSEHFILSNDDFFVNTPLPPDFFFTPDGLPTSYTTEFSYKQLQEYRQKYSDRMWFKLWMLPTKLFVEKFNMPAFYIIGNHNMSGILKSTFLQTLDMFPEFKNTMYSKFRTENDVSLQLLSMVDYVNGKTKLYDNNLVPPKFNCSPAGVLIHGRPSILERSTPCLFCLNETQGTTDEINEEQIKYLRQRFPDKSEFEK